ncbi:DUF3718 domain-containing protein [Thalassotalea fonticola]|uniref:DUF3718 domain-containing protein n=1 Tax=Thalassotalea fonticola TaxID=3065649 RepID=A0ABZ0GND2_9GAMM|nr:DUF3718 domain-containing protein [Colwelliaceae bacterium S1-1]
MKSINIAFLFVTIFTLFSVKSYADNVTFIAGDNSTATMLCVAAVSNDLVKTEKYIKRLSWQQTGMRQKTNFVLGDVSCNDANLIKFTAQYNADKTYDFLNNNAMNKYKLSDDEIKIIDLARVNSNNSAPQIIVITSR